MLVFPYCDKIPEVINLGGGKVYFGSEVSADSCLVWLPLGLWLCRKLPWGAGHHGVTVSLASRKPEVDREQRVYSLMVAPNGLTSGQ
jgi:hypothetical protein